MKQLIRRLSRVADSSHYTLLRSDYPLRRNFRRPDKIRRSSTVVPEGHVPIYVGDEMERFVVNAELLNHPIFVKLLNLSAQEYGYEQKGVLRLPCHVIVFERVLDTLRRGQDTREIQELLSFSSEEFRES
ncbi:putative small auxin-up RNA [Lupinus albus]|uniref:Putative small auxin-up RNA n=1 Tax=Lupinus albus TaxID=3870 RepID=A0A6A4N3G8_LUPAL|nr:putative small auxin-up RNA [Lupinus albus]